MSWARAWLLLAALGCLAFQVNRVPWLVPHRSADGTVQYERAHAPLWSPPEARQSAGRRDQNPPPPSAREPGYQLDWAAACMQFLILMWLPFGVAWVVYLGTSGKPDRLLRVAAFLFVSMGLTGIASIALAIITFPGGWFPPPELLVNGSAALGLVVALASGRRPRPPEPVA